MTTKLLRTIRSCFTVYVICAIIYTALKLCIPILHHYSSHSWNTTQILHMSPGDALHSYTRHNLQPSVLTSSDLYMSWPHSTALKEEDKHLALTSESLFLSKAFAHSMKPSKIVPFYYRALAAPDPQDVTLTTLITHDRFPIFVKLVKTYQGPISVAIHVQTSSSNVEELLNSLHALYTSSPVISHYVDVHLILDSFDRQFNMWRNVARLFARTSHVMMLDVDFAVLTDFSGALHHENSKAVLELMKDGRGAMVIPAFEYVNGKEGADQSMFPRTKADLVDLVNAGRVDMFHASWAPGHNSTNYTRYYSSAPGDVYKVTSYQSAYEPYVIFRQDGPSWCDERFIGYGGNKAACLFEMYISGMSFYVLTDHFLIHQDHAYAEDIRRNERKYNRQVYSDFKEEVCLRYLDQFTFNGLASSSVSENMWNECRKIKSISHVIEKARLAQGALGR